MNSEMHLEAVTERVRKCMWRLGSVQRYTLRDRVRVSLEIHLNAEIELVWRCTCRLLSSEIGGVLLEVVDLDAINGRRAGCRDSIDRLVDSKPSECDEVTLPLTFI